MASTSQVRARASPMQTPESLAMNNGADREAQWTSITSGTPVLVRYLDAVRFEAADASRYVPWILELIGWLDYQDKKCIRVVSERYREPSLTGKARLRSTGVSIVKSTIVELKRLVQDVRTETV
jgi:hypothetical protein